MSEYNITTICSWRNYSSIMRLATLINGWNPQIKQYRECWGWRKNVNTGQWEMLLTRSCTMLSWTWCNVEAVIFSSQIVYGWGQTTWVYLINKTSHQINYAWTLHPSVRVCSPWERCLGRCTRHSFMTSHHWPMGRAEVCAPVQPNSKCKGASSS